MARLSNEEIEARLGELQGWELSGNAIRKEFSPPDFLGAVGLVNKITPIAEELGHHPDLEVGWGKVEVAVTTHSEGGLTAKDFELAARIDAVA